MRPNTYGYLTDNSDGNKNAKGTKKCVILQKSNFEDYKNCLKAKELENEKNYLQKDKTDVDSLRGNYKEFINSNKLILKLQQRFRSEKHNVFTEEVNKIVLSAKKDKRTLSVNSKNHTHQKNDSRWSRKTKKNDWKYSWKTKKGFINFKHGSPIKITELFIFKRILNYKS